jgi:ABC-type uncharacterized transport system fused permease/ATPase subunit
MISNKAANFSNKKKSENSRTTPAITSVKIFFRLGSGVVKKGFLYLGTLVCEVFWMLNSPILKTPLLDLATTANEEEIRAQEDSLIHVIEKEAKVTNTSLAMEDKLSETSRFRILNQIPDLHNQPFSTDFVDSSKESSYYTAQVVNTLFDPNTGNKLPGDYNAYGFNMRFIKQTMFLSTIRPAYGWIYLFLFLLFTAGHAYIQSVVVPSYQGQLVAAMASLDSPQVVAVLIRLGMVVIASSLLFSLLAGLGSFSALQWREALTRHIQSRIFKSNLLYLIECMDNSLDNYDQRLSDSSRMYTNGIIGVCFGTTQHQIGSCLGGSIMTIVFSFVALSVTNSMIWFFVLAYLGLLVLFLSPQLGGVTRLQFQLDRYNGFFRFTQVKIRTFCESIAFYGGELKEKINCLDDFAKIYHTAFNYALAVSKLQATNLYFISVNLQNLSSLATLMAYFTIYFLYPQGALSAAFVTTTSLQLTNCFRAVASIPQNISALAPVAGDCHRLFELIEKISELEKKEAADLESIVSNDMEKQKVDITSPRAAPSDERVFSMSNVTVTAPETTKGRRQKRKKYIISNLNIFLLANETINVKGMYVFFSSNMIANILYVTM